MEKKLISVWLSLTILIFSSISIYAGEVIQGDFFLKNIVINGENIVNYELSDPVIMFRDRIYIPCSSEMESIMGFSAVSDNESRTLKIQKTEPVSKNLTDTSKKNNMDRVSVEICDDYTILACAAETASDNKGSAADTSVSLAAQASVVDDDAYYADECGIETLASLSYDSAKAESSTNKSSSASYVSFSDADYTDITNSELPVLKKDEVVYVPLNTIVSYEPFGWSSYYDSYSGVYISTDDDQVASSYFNIADSNYVKGRAAYINSRNRKVSMITAANMVRYFKYYGDIYGCDPDALLSMCEVESTFYITIVNRYNCIGLMQIKESTGKSYGYTRAQLLQMKYNIQAGTALLGESLSAFGGDYTKAISAHCYGLYGVKRGSYSTSYASKVFKKNASLDSYLAQNGYA